MATVSKDYKVFSRSSNAEGLAYVSLAPGNSSKRLDFTQFFSSKTKAVLKTSVSPQRLARSVQRSSAKTFKKTFNNCKLATRALSPAVHINTTQVLEALKKERRLGATYCGQTSQSHLGRSQSSKRPESKHLYGSFKLLNELLGDRRKAPSVESREATDKHGSRSTHQLSKTRRGLGFMLNQLSTELYKERLLRQTHCLPDSGIALKPKYS